MADAARRLAGNVPGAFFVDTSCIDCDACRHFAPEVFGDANDSAIVQKQPSNEREHESAQMALLACPVAAIGTQDKQDLTEARAAFPHALAGNIFVNGYNARSSFGAHSYFIRGGGENWLIDAPRFTKELVTKFDAMGGVDYIFLTHRDDVGDADKYAGHFSAERIIHAFEKSAQPDAEIILNGDGDHRIGAADILFTPGHTKGHMVLLWQGRYLFVGDHFAGRGVCWHSWRRQIDSMKKLAALTDVEWVLPGHGKWFQVPAGTFSATIERQVQQMQAAGAAP